MSTTPQLIPPSLATRTAIAVCGCGHDGRLGIGADAPSALQEITLIDDFLTDAMGEVLQMACGAYHTLVLTTTGLYGWGLHEDGQLGLGQPSTAAAKAGALSSRNGDEDGGVPTAVPPHVDRPTRLSFFDRLCLEATPSDPPAPSLIAEMGLVNEKVGQRHILSVHCGGDHSIVRTTAGLYVTGRNGCGQLGLGHCNSVFTWTHLCNTHAPVGSTATLALPWATHAGEAPRRVLQGQITHISCGTDHTLLAMSDALVLRPAPSSSATESVLPERGVHETGAVSPQHRLVFYPTLLLACGRGDFGELGYDGDAWSVLQAKAQRQEQALRTDLLHQQQRQGGMPASLSDDGVAAATPYKFKWKAAAERKQRRPAFNAPFLQQVQMAELDECAAGLPAAWADEVEEALLQTDAVAASMPSGSVLTISEPTQQQLQLLGASLCGGLASSIPLPAEPNDAAPRRPKAVVHLQAMHHHSAVTLCDRSSGTRASGAASAAPPQVLHWGCYYCSDIEDSAASHPRPIHDDVGRTNDVAQHVEFGVHAGEETLFRYSLPSLNHPAILSDDTFMLEVMGTGNLGLGSDDSLSRTWTKLALSPASTATLPLLSVTAMAGRTHYLIAGSTVDSELGCVMGFGDGLHGQLGSPAVRGEALHPSAETNPCVDEDAVVAPRMVLQIGDALRTAETLRSARCHVGAERRRQDATSATTHACEAPKATACWRVLKMRDVGAGARHSVFFVEVVPAAEALTDADSSR